MRSWAARGSEWERQRILVRYVHEEGLKKKGWKEIAAGLENGDVEFRLFFRNVHPYARMGTLRSSDTKAKTEETHAV